MDPVRLTDVTLRDGHQCLIATRLRTEDMLPACAQLDGIGFHSLEVWGGATFDACLRYLGEDPWERLHRLKAALPRTPLQMLLRGQNLLGYRHYADDVVRAFVARAVAGGIDIIRIFDAMNDARNLRVAIEATREAGAHAQGTLCYTTGPVHDSAQFVALARELTAMGAQSIAIKDMAGLLTPQATRELVGELVEALDAPVHLHAHATSGLSELCHWEAIRAGCRHIETALTPFAGGTSHPPTESMVAALAGTEHDTGLDLEALQAVARHFHEVRPKYHRFESRFTGVDTRVQVNQVPGGMVSNLASQLRDQGALEHFDAVLEETRCVREDLGYPPLVTPTSQIVGTQAVLNVLGGERYARITNEVKRYLGGHYGRAPGPVNEDVRRRAIGDEPVLEERPADHLEPEMERLIAEAGELAESREDVLTCALFPEIGRRFLADRRAGTLTPEPLEEAGDDRPGCPAPRHFHMRLDGRDHEIEVRGSGTSGDGARTLFLSVDGRPEEIDLRVLDSVDMHPAASGGGSGHGSAAGDATSAAGAGDAPAPGPADVTTTMPGTVVDILVAPGDAVAAGQAVLVIEAMKMESELTAPAAGTVTAIHCERGAAVAAGALLVAVDTAAVPET